MAKDVNKFQHYEIDVHTLVNHSVEDQKHMYDEKASDVFRRILSPFRRIRRLHMYCNQWRYLNIVKEALHPNLLIDTPTFMVDDFNIALQ